ncbi:MAG: FGGY family carbohydrate kinase, partial [Limosilactobacillus mucosae]
MTQKYILAIDQSTQGTKAILVDHNNQIFWKTALAHKQIISNTGWISHDLDEIRDNLRQLFVQVLKQITGDQIEALAITNQRESAAAWSRSSGKPLCKTVVWQDNRAASLVHELSTCQNQKMIKNKTGLALSPYFTAAKWAWMLKNEPAVQVAADHDDLCFGTMDSWLLYQLTDGRSFKTEPSNACRTQLMNLHDFSWDNDLCQLFNIPKSFLPEIVDSNAC